MSIAASLNAARFLADRAPPYTGMAIGPAFSLLTEKERLYAHWLNRASWEGARIIINQGKGFMVLGPLGGPRSRLEHGKDVFGKLLVDLQVRKSVADGDGGRAFYENLTNPPAHWLGDVRDMVLEKKQPRKILVHPNTVVQGGKVVLKEYDLSAEGTIQSFIERAI